MLNELGRENGVRKLVRLVFELCYGENQPDIFPNWKGDDIDTRVTKYTYFTLSMIDVSFEWMCTGFAETYSQMLIESDDFDIYLDFFREACRQINVEAKTISTLIQRLEQCKAKICVGDVGDANNLVKT